MTSATAPTRVVVGVGGGIAAYKACEVVRRLRAHDPSWVVTVVPTESALRFVGAATFEALSGNPVATDVWTDVPSVAHVSTGQHADLVVIAPATADLMARAATGRSDDLLTATLLVTRAPVLMAPAMHSEMWSHPATRANVATLRERGVVVVDPASGRLTGSDSGPGRLPDPEHIVALALLEHGRPGSLPQDLAGRTVVVTAGGTREALDPVRFLGNRSSGRQGFAVALVAAARGARVTLIAASTELPVPPGVQLVRVSSTAELAAATAEATRGADALVMAAAVADFRPAEAAAHKIKKEAGRGPEPLALVENPDVLAALSRPGPGRPAVVVGFAAETGEGGTDAEIRTAVLAHGRAKIARKGCDLLVVNRVDGGRAFGAEDNAAVLLSREGDELPVPFGPKTVLAAVLCDAVAARLASRVG
ncbi:phosphopantothenoylcysteine decarboxylase/phosphopantothenate--cysteine ligase [Nakamurella flavida]|uniref:bifunctional phosphopantothenoylcysteine decarboxylase/phosphopantothenate--cysteine ligase CoaBC n=1 Tax=Nakamurella flavida TaxID=363630 RepID=UPI00278875CD|nr:bifunctional phosphopantothenoylcysteine decarboxylase/phosphopantothenate--cysteine ligase CoaBC [Nakamurella flavida]MDP9777634.1 phosphopantothenoylcysteine decarboxylase/phosphopantothenate--cysteine ligase [Nakamurella flavida]